MRMISRFFYLIITMLILVFIIWFTVSNPQQVTFNLNGADFVIDLVSGRTGGQTLTLPAYLWAFIIFAFGFVFGMIATLMSGGKGRARKRELKRKLRTTKKELIARSKEVEQVRGISDDIDPVALIKR